MGLLYPWLKQRTSVFIALSVLNFALAYELVSLSLGSVDVFSRVRLAHLGTLANPETNTFLQFWYIFTKIILPLKVFSELPIAFLIAIVLLTPFPYKTTSRAVVMLLAVLTICGISHYLYSKFLLPFSVKVIEEKVIGVVSREIGFSLLSPSTLIMAVVKGFVLYGWLIFFQGTQREEEV